MSCPMESHLGCKLNFQKVMVKEKRLQFWTVLPPNYILNRLHKHNTAPIKPTPTKKQLMHYNIRATSISRNVRILLIRYRWYIKVFSNFLFFLVAYTRRYKSLCRLDGRSDSWFVTLLKFLPKRYSRVRLEFPNRGRLYKSHFSIYKAKIWYGALFWPNKFPDSGKKIQL